MKLLPGKNSDFSACATTSAADAVATKPTRLLRIDSAELERATKEAPELAAEQGAIGLKVAANLLAWPALLRKAYRLDPSFAT